MAEQNFFEMKNSYCIVEKSCYISESFGQISSSICVFINRNSPLPDKTFVIFVSFTATTCIRRSKSGLTVGV